MRCRSEAASLSGAHRLSEVGRRVSSRQRRSEQSPETGTRQHVQRTESGRVAGAEEQEWKGGR